MLQRSYENTVSCIDSSLFIRVLAADMGIFSRRAQANFFPMEVTTNTTQHSGLLLPEARWKLMT